mgnify:CR=1 FL=1
MSDIECPYCGKEQDINHDDGAGYTEGVAEQQTCDDCGNTFAYTTEISFSHTAYKADCLNDGEHDYQLTHTSPKEFSKMECSMCDDSRELTEAERIKFGIGTKEDLFKRLESAKTGK